MDTAGCDFECAADCAGGGDFLLHARDARIGVGLHQLGGKKGSRLGPGIAVELVYVQHEPAKEVGFERCHAEPRAARVAGAREAAHARELAINRQQQQIVFDREQVTALEERTLAIAAEAATIEARREPAQAVLADRCEAAVEAEAERDRAAVRLTTGSEAYESVHREIEGLESDVEAARSDVFSAINSATALRHALETSMPGIWAIGAVRAGYSGLLCDAAAEAQKAAEGIVKRLRFD